MPQETAVPCNGVLSSFWQAHKIEIIWAIVFAVVFGLLCEGFRQILKFRKLLKKRNSSQNPKLRRFIDMINIICMPD
jgi:hypothetical protein